MLRLEAMIATYDIQNASALFESGFQYAWNLFHDLTEEQTKQVTISSKTQEGEKNTTKEYEFHKRLDLQHLREFLLHGTETVEINSKSYQERVKDAGKGIYELLERTFLNENERENATNLLYCYINAVEEVYMEIGMQCGAEIFVQLLSGKISKNNI